MFDVIVYKPSPYGLVFIHDKPLGLRPRVYQLSHQTWADLCVLLCQEKLKLKWTIIAQKFDPWTDQQYSIIEVIEYYLAVTQLGLVLILYFSITSVNCRYCMAVSGMLLYQFWFWVTQTLKVIKPYNHRGFRELWERKRRILL